MPRTPRGFTLVELIAVVAILTVLLTLLVPALDKAIYMAELTKCATNHGDVARGVAVYARDYRRSYPHRQAMVTGGEPAYVLQSATLDDRPVIRSHIPINKLLNDPIGQNVDLEAPGPGSQVDAAIHLWFGVKFQGPLAGAGMMKLDDRLEWSDESTGHRVTHRFRLVASDLDVVSVSATTARHSHPDKDGRMMVETSEGMDVTGLAVEGKPVTPPPVYSRWVSTTDHQRGPVDSHAAYDNGSVERYKGVAWDDARMVSVPHRTDATDWPAWVARVPRR